MFDNINFKIENFESSDFEYFLKNSIPQQLFRNRGNWYQVDWHNLRINYFPNQQLLKVSNSIHKFFNAEISGLGLINSNAFTKKQVCETVNYLEKAFNRNSSEMKLLGKFEFGLNISTGDYEPFNDIIDRYQSIVTTARNPFYAFYNNSKKPYAKFCSFTHYKVKVYSKSKESGIVGKNILRFEIANNSSIKTRQVFGKKDISLKDLMDNQIWDNAFTSLLKSYDSIRTLAFPSDGILKYTKAMCYSFSTLNKDYQKSFKNVFHDLKNNHDELIKSPNNPHSMVRNGLIEKYKNLITDETETI